MRHLARNSNITPAPTRAGVLSIVAVVIIGVVVAMASPRMASGKVTRVVTASSTSGDTGALDTGGAPFRIQFCGGAGGDAFSGSFVVKQGAQTTTLVQTYSSGAIAGLDGCSVTYYVTGFGRSAFASIVTTRSAGKYTIYLEEDRP